MLITFSLIYSSTQCDRVAPELKVCRSDINLILALRNSFAVWPISCKKRFGRVAIPLLVSRKGEDAFTPPHETFTIDPCDIPPE